MQNQFELGKQSFKTERRSVSLSVVNTGLQRCAPNYSWGPGIRDHYLIHCVMTGCGTFQINGNKFQVNAGDLFLIPPNFMASYRADAHDPWTYAWVGFNGQDALYLLDQAGFSKDRPVITSRETGPLESDLKAIYNCRGSRVQDNTRMTGRLYEFMSDLIDLTNNEVEADDDPLLYTVRSAMEFIDGNYSHPIQADDIARYAGTSRSGLYRGFKRHFSLAPMQYVNQHRIERACVLLQSKGSAIAEIAHSVGYDDPLYFSRAFKASKGISPKQYRAVALGKL